MPKKAKSNSAVSNEKKPPKKPSKYKMVKQEMARKSSERLTIREDEETDESSNNKEVVNPIFMNENKEPISFYLSKSVRHPQLFAMIEKYGGQVVVKASPGTI